MLIDLPVNTTLISIIDETDTKTNNKNLTLRRSKSVDSFTTFKKNIIKRNIFYTEHINPDINYTDRDNISDCNRECCTFQ